MFTMHCSCILQDCHLGKHLLLLEEITSRYGIGFNDTSQRGLFLSRRSISEFIVDETLIKAGSDYVRLWVAIEPKNKMILGIRISLERSMLVAEQFIQSLIRKYGKHNISTDGGTWYPQACRYLNVEHHLHSSVEQSFIERNNSIH
jgi:transposase-like protein